MSIQHLKSYKPGQCGNPNGRPKGAKSITSHLKELLERRINVGKTKFNEDGLHITAKQAVAIALISGAIEGDTAKIRELLDRIDGTSKQVLEIENTDKPSADDIYSDIKKRLANAKTRPVKSKKKS
jgi:hypothetical protein